MSEERDALLARQLLAQMDGQPLPETEEEARSLAAFAQELFWPAARPAPVFRGQLRRKLVESAGAARPGRFRVPRWAYAGAAVVIIIVVGILIVGTPRLSPLFGSVYNSLGWGDDRYYGQLAPAPAKETVVVGGTPQVVYATVPAAPTPTAGGDVGPSYPASAHMIIKDAQLQLLVEDTDVALDRLTGIAGQYGGYILSSQSWYDGIYKQATIVIQVPAASFEQALSRVRQVALKVERETAAGQDVTAQYVDLEAQLGNLEATAARLRTFLEKAATMDEALRINNELSRIEGQIERIKGQMNYLATQAAYSTITVDLHPPRPTPTPAAWQPGQAAEQATTTLASVGQFLVEALIWIGIVLVPLVGVPALVIFLVVRVTRGRRKQTPPPA